MNQKITFILVTLFLVACGNAPIKEIVKESYPNNQAKIVEYVQEIDGKEQVVEQKTYFNNGQFKMGGKLKAGKRDGKWAAYFENGKIQSDGEFDEGIRTGKTKIYYDNGNLMYDGQYENDKKIGTWKFYNKAGKFVTEENFK
jgi:antitoxin component YwqK of YwqJK toxin-antitoxin module